LQIKEDALALLAEIKDGFSQASINLSEETDRLEFDAVPGHVLSRSVLALEQRLRLSKD